MVIYKPSGISSSGILSPPNTCDSRQSHMGGAAGVPTTALAGLAASMLAAAVAAATAADAAAVASVGYSCAVSVIAYLSALLVVVAVLFSAAVRELIPSVTRATSKVCCVCALSSRSLRKNKNSKSASHNSLTARRVVPCPPALVCLPRFTRFVRRTRLSCLFSFVSPSTAFTEATAQRNCQFRKKWGNTARCK